MALDKIIIENFRAFKGQHIFDLRQLNIFTGANNSGKSTLIKAISLFSKGLEKGDFPFVDLFESNSYSFKELVNRDSESKSFKIGFFVEIGDRKIPIKVMYEFVDGSGTEKSENAAVFNRLELLSLQDDVLMFVQNTETFRDAESVNFHDEGYPIHSPMTYQNPALAFLAINIEEAQKFCLSNCETDFSILFNHLNQIKQEDGFWWCELFEEEEFDFLGLWELSFEDLVIDMFRDPFYNLTSFEGKETLIFSEKTPDDYFQLKDTLNYEGFLHKVINEVFQSIEIELEKYRNSNFEYVSQQSIGETLFMRNHNFNFLNYLIRRKNDSQAFNEFMRHSLSLFGIDGYVELKTVHNTMLELYLVSELKETDELNNTISQGLRSINAYDYLYKDNPRMSIHELGKGLQSLIFTMARMFVVINRFRIVRWKNIELEKAKGKANIQNNPNLILIEEPEAFLHPNWQSRLADFFVFCNEYSQKNHQKTKINMVIETHSIFLIQRLQILIGEHVLSEKDVQVLYFNDMSNKEKYERLRLNKDGVFMDSFGSGFDSDIFKNASKLANIVSKN